MCYNVSNIVPYVTSSRMTHRLEKPATFMKTCVMQKQVIINDKSQTSACRYNLTLSYIGRFSFGRRFPWNPETGETCMVHVND